MAHPRPARRPVLTAARLLPVLVLAALVGGCGAAQDDASGARSDLALTEPAPAEGLVITVTDAGGTVTSWTLDCGGTPSGTHPKPAEACAALAENPGALTPVPRDAMCTMQDGGDDTATITGSWRGRQLQASFSLKGGCEISRWEDLVPLLPAVGAGGASSLNN